MLPREKALYADPQINNIVMYQDKCKTRSSTTPKKLKHIEVHVVFISE
jgi:hypothetical protein